MPSPFAPPGLSLHHATEIDALAERLADDQEDSPCALLITGQPGEGRRYVIARAVEAMRGAGLNALYAAVDLDGYEPERADPPAYAQHAAAKRGAVLDPADEGWIRRSIRGPRPSLHDFLAAALLAGRDGASVSLRERLTEAFAATDPWSALAESLGPDERLIVHIADTAELPAVARDLLLELSARFPRFKTVISCSPDDGLGKVVRGRSNLRFEVMPLDPGELRSLLEERLGEPGLLSKDLLAMSRVFSHTGTREQVIAVKGSPKGIFDLCHLKDESISHFEKSRYTNGFRRFKSFRGSKSYIGFWCTTTNSTRFRS